SARDGSPRGEAVRRLPLGPQARAHSQEARQGAQGALDARRRATKQRAPRVLALRVAFAGTPEFALPALAALLKFHDVVGVLTQPDRPSGRGRRLSASPVKTLAEAHHLKLLQPATLRDEAAQSALAALKPEVLVVVAYGLILPPAVLGLPSFGCLNIHASLLPRWRGAAPVQRAILAGDEATGITIMQMEAGLDTGPMLLKRAVEIEDKNTAQLTDELAQLGASMM